MRGAAEGAAWQGTELVSRNKEWSWTTASNSFGAWGLHQKELNSDNNHENLNGTFAPEEVTTPASTLFSSL